MRLCCPLSLLCYFGFLSLVINLRSIVTVPKSIRHSRFRSDSTTQIMKSFESTNRIEANEWKPWLSVTRQMRHFCHSIIYFCFRFSNFNNLFPIRLFQQTKWIEIIPIQFKCNKYKEIILRNSKLNSMWHKIKWNEEIAHKMLSVCFVFVINFVFSAHFFDVIYSSCVVRLFSSFFAVNLVDEVETNRSCDVNNTNQSQL